MTIEAAGQLTHYVSHISQYGRAELRFRAETESGERIAESPIFKGDASYGPNPRDLEHQDALATLLDRLRELGWAAAPEPGQPWYARRLWRADPPAQ